MRLERGIFMNEQIQAVVDLLQAKNIDYSIIEHIPVYTIDEILALDLPEANLIAKNLFIRDDKKKNYYIIVVAQDKKVNLKALK
jgi:Ala-tRNA(Pro) deacylase